MPPYGISLDAEKDLREVARYTLRLWNKTTLEAYREGLKKTFTAIGKQEVPRRYFSERFPSLLVTKYRYHYIFYLAQSNTKPIIIGVIHEKRDIVNRLRERLKV